MRWVVTADVDRFLASAGPFLESDPVANNILLTEAHFCSRLPSAAVGGTFGWWVGDSSVVEAAFVHVPDHALICSRVNRSAAEELADAVPGATWLGVDAEDRDAVTDAFAVRGTVVGQVARLSVLRLNAPVRSRVRPSGSPRPAEPRELPVLRDWFQQFQKVHPEDRSHAAFVLDQPLEDGGLTVWEDRGALVAMASRTPRLGGMVRLGLAFQPRGGTAYAEAAFDAACAEADRSAEIVLVLSGSDESTTSYQARGFTKVSERVVLRERRRIPPTP